jgi:biotin transport system substrate-specific component
MRGVDANLPVPGISAERRAAEAPATAIIREQTLGVLLLGALYGPWRGAATVIAYLAEGTAGLPVFALGRSGLPVLLGPTGGFLVGFIPAAFVAGLAGGARPAAVRLGILLVATLVVYACGVPWLALNRAMPLEAALIAGMLPFIPGDVLKAGVAAGVAPAGSRLLSALPGFRPR